jgi:hypothetical protein
MLPDDEDEDDEEEEWRGPFCHGLLLLSTERNNSKVCRFELAYGVCIAKLAGTL